ncbi:MAG: alpha/beta hydrolase family protein [Omnitrophica WOR_2 bacterium]
MITCRFIVRTLILLTGLSLAGIFLFAGILFWLRNGEVNLPQPGGSYPVGRIEYDWTDTSRLDPFVSNPQEPRKLNVWIWYPGEQSTSLTAPAPYLPTAWAAALEHNAGAGALLRQNLAHVHSHSILGLRLSTRQAAYPVLLMQPGLGPILPDYTTLCESLASYGYIVVGSTPTGSSSVVVFNDGEIANGTPQGNVPDNASVADTQRILGNLIQVWAEDDRFVLNQVEHLNSTDPTGPFTGHMDLSAVGVMGHSFGGATAAQFCSLDLRCKAGIDLDGYPYGSVIQTGLSQPFMFMWSEPVDANTPAGQRASRDTQAIFLKLPHGSMQVTIRGMRHFNFTDDSVEFDPALRLLGLLGPIDGVYGLKITSTYVRAFFDAHLRRLPQPLLEKTSSPFPEVQIKQR